MIDQKYPKSNRILKKKEFEVLLNRGIKIAAYPFLGVYAWTEGICGLQIAISVKKKIFKRAVKRNKIKRRIREIFRKNKHAFPSNIQTQNLKLLIVYISKKVESFEIFEKAFLELITILNEKYRQD